MFAFSRRPFFALILILVVALSFVACESKSTDKKETEKKDEEKKALKILAIEADMSCTAYVRQVLEEEVKRSRIGE